MAQAQTSNKEELVLALQHWDSEHRCLVTHIRRSDSKGQAELMGLARHGDMLFKLPSDSADDLVALMQAIARARTDNNFINV